MELFKEYIVHLTVDSELGNKFPVSSIYDKPGSDEIIFKSRKKLNALNIFIIELLPLKIIFGRHRL